MSDKKNRLDFGEYVVRKDQEPGRMGINECASMFKNTTNAEPGGIISQYKANKIKQNTALQMMRKYHHSQIEVSKHKFLKAVMQNKPLSDINADKILEELNQKYFDSLKQLGIKNTEEHEDSLIQLERQTSEILAVVDNKDLSEPMKQKNVEQIFQLIKKVERQMMVEN